MGNRWGLGKHESTAGLCLSKAHPGRTTEPRRAGGTPARSPVPLTETRLGRMVTEPSATSSRCRTGAILEPQLSEPIQMKCPVWFARLAASSTLLPRDAPGAGARWGTGSVSPRTGGAQAGLSAACSSCSGCSAPGTTRGMWIHRANPRYVEQSEPLGSRTLCAPQPGHTGHFSHLICIFADW